MQSGVSAAARGFAAPEAGVDVGELGAIADAGGRSPGVIRRLGSNVVRVTTGVDDGVDRVIDDVDVV